MDKYTKLAKIGSGSFGCAYLVTRKADPLAKKFVVKEIRMDPRDQHGALREAKLLAALDHPNIIACKESFLLAPAPAPVNGRAPQQQQQVLCIVTEYADGGDLRKKLEQHIASRSRLKETEVLDLFVQCCLALKHLHDRKIIHRDIKPENVFLMKSNVVKLGDFGVATVLSNTFACAETMTGTPYYTSPEICMGRRYNSKTDIWSLGCVLYELVTFAHAFNGRSQRQLFDNIMNASFVSIATVLTGAGAGGVSYSRGLSELVGEMLRKNPRDRPSVNQIIKKPIVMERIQGFLSERALAEELNHTVLHGHHIFRKNNNPVVKAPAPAPTRRAPDRVEKSSALNVAAPDVVRRAEVVFAEKKRAVTPSAGAKVSPSPLKQLGGAGAPRKKKAAPVASSRAPSVLLKKSRSFKKAAPSPSRPPSAAAKSPADDRKRAAPSPPPRYLTPTKALEQKNRLLLQRKKAIVEKAKQEALRARLVPSGAASGVGGGGEPTNPQVADRISAFNAQWQAQRQQLLHNLPSSPPPPFSIVGAIALGSGALLPPPPPAPVSAVASKKAAGVNGKPSEYPKPVTIAAPEDQHQVFVPPAAPISVVKSRKGTAAAEVKAAAAKQRDAMRKDIQSRKQEVLKKAAAGAGADGGRSRAVGAGASPLDDPIILVQNLPDFYQMMEPPPPSTNNTGKTAESNAGAPTLASSPPAPVSAVVPVSGSDLDDEPDDDGDGDGDADGDAEDETNESEAPVSLEFERMVLQLKSVIESSALDDADDDDDDNDDEPDVGNPFQQPRIPEETEEDASLTATSPLPPVYYTDTTDSSLSELKVSILQDPSFTKALQALLAVKETATGEVTEAAILSNVAPGHKPALLWMRSYVSTLTSGSAPLTTKHLSD